MDGAGGGGDGRGDGGGDAEARVKAGGETGVDADGGSDAQPGGAVELLATEPNTAETRLSECVSTYKHRPGRRRDENEHAVEIER